MEKVHHRIIKDIQTNGLLIENCRWQSKRGRGEEYHAWFLFHKSIDAFKALRQFDGSILENRCLNARLAQSLNHEKDIKVIHKSRYEGPDETDHPKGVLVSGRTFLDYADDPDSNFFHDDIMLPFGCSLQDIKSRMMTNTWSNFAHYPCPVFEKLEFKHGLFAQQAIANYNGAKLGMYYCAPGDQGVASQRLWTQHICRLGLIPFTETAEDHSLKEWINGSCDDKLLKWQYLGFMAGHLCQHNFRIDCQSVGPHVPMKELEE